VTTTRIKIARLSAKQQSGELQRYIRYRDDAPHNRSAGWAMELEARQKNIYIIIYQLTGEAAA
jgi:hypothetical protein